MSDYLSREEILRVFDNLTVKNPDDKYQHGMQDAIDCLIPEVINGMEATDVQPIKRGRWENEYLDDDDVWCADCTNCNNETHSIFSKVSIYAYCPNCGAKMIKDGGENE